MWSGCILKEGQTEKFGVIPEVGLDHFECFVHIASFPESTVFGVTPFVCNFLGLFSVIH